ncbi:MAG: cyclase family protein [Pseudomonadota bacterium]|nr:cyclase family protein [Pseudomonadota bacterium]MEC8439392.1 cyclase family protein [Pseudomonadota bacterium]MEC9213924.1 cyclase family protein [Pseudomonadota bacterium]
MSFIVNLIRTSLSLVLIVATSAVSADECVPSPWGADDQIGAANRVTPERTAAAAKLVKKGISHPLGIVIEPGMPAYPPRYTQLQVVQPNQQFNADLGVGWEASSNDDVLQMWLGTGPQLDGLGHMGEAGEFYNCNQGKDFSIITGLTKLDISGIPPMVGRGVMIDIAKQMGVDSLQAGQPITSDDIKAAMKSQGVTVGEGDVVLLHTGYTDATLKQNPSLWAGSIPGITNEASVFLAGLKPMAVGADTWGLGAVPPRAGDKIFYDHVVLLKQHGIYILETMNTGRLADEGVHEFMFVLGQARLKGAVQMIINPVAMW